MAFRELGVEDYPRFLQIYNESFPEDERRLYRVAGHVEEVVREKGGKFRGFVYDDGGDFFLGVMTYWIFEGYVYVEHFAVDPNQRGKSIGSKMLGHLFETVSPNVLIEVEMPGLPETDRRIAFYERNGFRKREEIKYIQPPYSPGQKGMQLLIMTHGEVEIKDMGDMEEMLREVYNVNKGI